MKTIFSEYYKDSNVQVTETDDADYARSCFEGTDPEWKEVVEQSANGLFYIVSSGLAGLYMADSVWVFADKETAIRDAKDTLERWRDEDGEEEEDETE